MSIYLPTGFIAEVPCIVVYPVPVPVHSALAALSHVVPHATGEVRTDVVTICKKNNILAMLVIRPIKQTVPMST